MHHRSPKLKEEAIGSARECIHLLRLVAVSWPAAGHKADILASLVASTIRRPHRSRFAQAQNTSGPSAYLGQNSLPSPQEYSLQSVSDQGTIVRYDILGKSSGLAEHDVPVCASALSGPV